MNVADGTDTEVIKNKRILGDYDEMIITDIFDYIWLY